jgi:hypothetical protein
MGPTPIGQWQPPHLRPAQQLWEASTSHSKGQEPASYGQDSLARFKPGINGNGHQSCTPANHSQASIQTTSHDACMSSYLAVSAVSPLLPAVRRKREGRKTSKRLKQRAGPGQRWQAGRCACKKPALERETKGRRKVRRARQQGRMGGDACMLSCI